MGVLRAVKFCVEQWEVDQVKMFGKVVSRIWFGLTETAPVLMNLYITGRHGGFNCSTSTGYLSMYALQHRRWFGHPAVPTLAIL
jgi:hypothetical protein